MQYPTPKLKHANQKVALFLEPGTTLAGHYSERQEKKRA